MDSTSVDLSHLQQWIGRSRESVDTVTVPPIEQLCATLDISQQFSTGDALPPAWQWLYFLDAAPTGQLSHDGHPEPGVFMPPVPFPRRMWAGGSSSYSQPLRIGQTVSRHSTISNVALKQGRSGPLIFVPVRHTFSGENGAALVEEQTIVYRPAQEVTATPLTLPHEASQVPDWSRQVTPSAVLLFRYSALTFNSHRIHYDLDYCLEEGYPGLVVHGPLTVTLLLELLRHHLPQTAIKHVTYRAVSPLFVPDTFTLHGQRQGTSVTLWALASGGQLAMQATATLE